MKWQRVESGWYVTKPTRWKLTREHRGLWHLWRVKLTGFIDFGWTRTLDEGKVRARAIDDNETEEASE